MSKITLEQWRVLQTVVDSGGFTQAAEVLHKSQSSVSYSVTKLQQQLGFSILVMEGRKAKLTQRGQLLLKHSRELLKQSDQLDCLAKSLESGWGDELSLYIDSSIPYSIVLEALANFKEKSPGTQVVLNEGCLPDTLANSASTKTTYLSLIPEPSSLDQIPILELELVAVVSSHHSLATHGLSISNDILSREHQIKLSSACIQPDKSGPSSFVSNIPALIETVSRGFGYAWLPLCDAKRFLNKGELVCLSLVEFKAATQAIYVQYNREEDESGVAGLFIETLKNVSNR